MKLKDYRENLMNERIKELAIEADIMAPTWNHVPLGYQKFAELIVKECVTVGQDAFLHGSTVPVFPTIQIKRHFGVEE